jgi:hypothetical protein
VPNSAGARTITSSTPKDDELLDWLALMRHYHAPSRLLDFSKSPYVAAFFAIAEAKPEDSAAIWAIDGFAIKRHAADLLDKESMSVRLKEYGATAFKDPGFSFSDPRVYKAVFGSGLQSVPARVVIPVEPFLTNERVLLQQGVFLCPVTLEGTFAQALINVVQHAKKSDMSATPVMYKISIFPKAHPNILRELHRMNISYATLFPGLEGLAGSLATVCKIRATTVAPAFPADREFGIKF